MGGSAITVLYIEDHAMVREAISGLIELQPDMTVVASAGSGEEAIELYRRHHPDVTILDLQLPKMTGIEAIRAIRQESPAARIIVLTMYHGDEDIHRALTAGAMSYLLKDMASDDLVKVVRDVHAGRRPLLPDVATHLATREVSGTLTPRECEVVRLIAAGMRNKEIAAALNISEQTVLGHTKNIFAKLNVNDRSTAVRVAVQRGIVHLI